jgi:acyl-CoA synthetase (AMP-forming)/AMP-acid ligase II
MRQNLRVNVAAYLKSAAEACPRRSAVVWPRAERWEALSYAELDRRSDLIAHGFAELGITRGERTLVMVRAGAPLITLTYALFKLGAVPVLIDPGMGVGPFLRCVRDTAPTAFLGIPLAHALRRVFPSAFRSVRTLLTAGPRLFWGGATLEAILRDGERRARPEFPLAGTAPDDVAAVLFTSGSTGPAKGAIYTHGNFAAQVDLLQGVYGFMPGEVDLAAFPLFSLFDCAFQMTSVIPELDPSRPGTCDPAKVARAISANGCTSAFGSPAVWRRLAPHCIANGTAFPKLRRVLIAGASVPAALVEQVKRVIAADGDVHTPYGATEALPVATISGREILEQTAPASRDGKGTCVGRTLPRLRVELIRISDDPIPSWSQDLVCGPGAVGEIAVKGPVVTSAYLNRPEATALAKIRDGDGVWHRTGDLGYFDRQGRLWFVGRKAERVRSAAGPLYTDCVEGLFSADARVSRCALVGVGEPGKQRAYLVVEGRADSALARDLMARAGGLVEGVLFHPRFPVDVRHNAKIHRHTLAAWAERRLGQPA